MDVASTTATTNNAAPPAGGAKTAAEKSKLDYDSFLTLLVAQLKNQDPTEPRDSATYIAQLATFSNVEQAIKTNAKLDSLMTAFALSQADGVLGRTVTSADGLSSGTVTSLRIVEGGTVAILEDGTELALGEGVTIS